MVRALRVVTVERGIDPRRFALLPFGGAGPMHAAAIAAELGIERILCPRAGGVLSALGLCASDRRRDTTRTVMLSGADLTAERIAAEVDELVAGSTASLAGRRARGRLRDALRRPGLRAAGAGDARDPTPPTWSSASSGAHEERYGHRDPDGEVVLVDIRLALVAPGPRPRPAAAPAGPRSRRAPQVRFDGEWVETPVLRGEPPAGLERRGPGRLRAARGDLRRPARLARRGRRDRHDRAEAGGLAIGAAAMSALDPVTLQVMIGGLRAACEEMGAALIRSAYSANIKERHDCSTALFDARGELVMQAEHIPVHLGSMPDAVAAVLDEEQRPGDAWILNDPYRGGTHLPDITLISPVFAAGELLGFAACRAHHADVGGPTPGGMPARSRTLDEEGVVIPPTRADEAELERARRADALAAPAPRRPARAGGRQPDRRAAPGRAGRAPRPRRGCAPAWTEILAYAERRTRAALAALPDGTYRAEDVLEDDAGGEPRDVVLRVEATIRGDRLLLDFSGTDPQVDGNLNCPLSVTKSAAFFAVRVLTDPDAPPSRRRLPADRGARARRAACSTPASRPPSPPATSRPRAASPTW